MLIFRAAAAILRMRKRRRGTLAEADRATKDYMRIPRPMAEIVMCCVREKERVA